MNIEPTDLPGVLIITPRVFKDARGFFFESYNAEQFKARGIDTVFVQDNHSQSTRGTLRGLHFQLPPMAQDKLVRCVRGAIWDVAVDIRADSPTFGRWVGVELSAEQLPPDPGPDRVRARLLRAERRGRGALQNQRGLQRGARARHRLG